MSVDGRFGHVGVHREGAILIAELLDLSSAFNAGPNRFGGFAFATCPEFFDTEGGCFDMNVDTVEERTADAATVTLDLGWGATAFALFRTKISARAGIHCSDEHEIAGQSDFSSGT